MMSKWIALLLVLAMVIQIIKPIGWPGLRRRSDFWKLSLVALALWTLDLVFRDLLM